MTAARLTVRVRVASLVPRVRFRVARVRLVAVIVPPVRIPKIRLGALRVRRVALGNTLRARGRGSARPAGMVRQRRPLITPPPTPRRLEPSIVWAVEQANGTMTVMRAPHVRPERPVVQGKKSILKVALPATEPVPAAQLGSLTTATTTLVVLTVIVVNTPVGRGIHPVHPGLRAVRVNGLILLVAPPLTEPVPAAQLVSLATPTTTRVALPVLVVNPPVGRGIHPALPVLVVNTPVGRGIHPALPVLVVNTPVGRGIHPVHPGLRAVRVYGHTKSQVRPKTETARIALLVRTTPGRTIPPRAVRARMQRARRMRPSPGRPRARRERVRTTVTAPKTGLLRPTTQATIIFPPARPTRRRSAVIPGIRTC